MEVAAVVSRWGGTAAGAGVLPIGLQMQYLRLFPLPPVTPLTDVTIALEGIPRPVKKLFPNLRTPSNALKCLFQFYKKNEVTFKGHLLSQNLLSQTF